MVLVRLGELTLKGPKAREEMVRILIGNIVHRFRERGAEMVYRREGGRLYVHTPDLGTAKWVLSRSFGVRSFSPSIMVDAELGSILEAALSEIPEEFSGTFAVRVRRRGDFPLTSQETAARLGEGILGARPGASVDLENPDLEVGVEIRGSIAYVFTYWCPGPGGLPLGSEGTAVAYVDSAEGALAAWLVLRRGARLRIFSPSGEGEVLRDWCHLCPFLCGSLQDAAEDARKRGYGLVLPRPAGVDATQLLPLSSLAVREFMEVMLRGPGPCRRTRTIYK